MHMQRRPTDDKARIQASLRDAAVVGTVNPGLERPGYLRASLRDERAIHQTPGTCRAAASPTKNNFGMHRVVLATAFLD